MGKFSSFKIAWFLGVLFISLFLSAARCEAQGTITVLQTGGGNPLVSSQENISLNAAVSSELVFEFGFLSDEVAAPDTFLDSLTVTLQGSGGGTAVLLTADASGVSWAPPTTGGITLIDTAILRQLMTPPPDAPIFGRGIAYSVTVPIPQGILGLDGTLYFDLFDNQNSQQSIGWYTPPKVIPVPEPSLIFLFAAAPLAFLIIRIRRKQVHAVARR